MSAWAVEPGTLWLAEAAPEAEPLVLLLAEVPPQPASTLHSTAAHSSNARKRL